MASDVEVLREWYEALLAGRDPVPTRQRIAALGGFLAALEAREAQPKTPFDPRHHQHANLVRGLDEICASEAALSERVAALTAQNAYLRQTLEDVREWAGPKHVMVFDDGDVAVSDYVQAALDFKGVELPPKPETP